MNTERLKKKIEVFSTEICGEMELDELRAILNDVEKNQEAQCVELETDMHYDRCGDFKGSTSYLNFFKYVPETDEEYYSRIEKEKEEDERKKEAAKKRKEREKKKRKLKKKKKNCWS